MDANSQPIRRPQTERSSRPAAGRLSGPWPWFGWASLAGSLLSLACSGTDGTPLPGECGDTSKSLTNCGACGNSCAAGQDCQSGQCVCMTGLNACSTGCVNLREDSKNCGTCGNSCAQGLVCSNGTCSSACAQGLQVCGASCIDTRTSSANCGACGTECGSGQACNNGQCQCTSDRTTCNGACVDLQQDSFNCGRCNNACPTNSECRNGNCQPASSGSGGGVGIPLGGSGGAGGVTSGGGLGGGLAAGGTSSGGSASGGATPGGGSASGGASSGGSNNAGASSGGATGSGGSSGGGCGKTGFYVQNKKIYDNTCAEFVMRGVNYPYAWYSSRNIQEDFAAIAATGANSVRVVLSSGDFVEGTTRWTRTTGANLTSILSAAKAAKLVVIAEVHDVTGSGDQQRTVQLTAATDYWKSAEIANVLKGQESFVIINIANEPYGNATSAQWATGHVSAVQTLRSAGFKHMLMVDAPNWGQDWENRMRNGGGSSIWDADADKNLVFSVHMYDVYKSADIVTSYFTTYMNNYQAPLVVGEFAADHGSSGNVDEDTIMSYAEMLGVGYIGWSWSGNGGGLGTLDITNNFNAASLTTWGTRLISGANGIKATSEVCNCLK